MTGARQRYEEKTRVVTFRVNLEVYDELEEIRSKGGLSYADLIKAGAGIAGQEITAKLAQISGLESRLAELSNAVKEKEEELRRLVHEERVCRLQQLDTEMRAFKLFDCRWTVEQIKFKLGISHREVIQYFQQWVEERNDGRAVRREMLLQCLKEHIKELKSSKSWARILSSTPPGAAEDLDRQIGHYQNLLSAPSRINKAERGFLLAEYSAKIMPRGRKA